MKKKSLITNFILNTVRISSATLIGLIMMPYINRVLGVANVGKVEYSNTIINYLIMFSALGIPIYGIREIAKVRDNLFLRTKITVELLIILGITSLVSYIVIFVGIYLLGMLSAYSDLLLILSSAILLTNVGAEWFFQGLENQTYITVRYVIIRLLTLVLLFVLVRTPDDYKNYAWLLVLNAAGSNIFNIFYITKLLDFKGIKLRNLEFKKHFRPILTIFTAAIAVNIYSQLDSFLIGYMVGDRYLAFYINAFKLVRYAVTFITIIGSVTLPRLSVLWHNDIGGYYDVLKSAYGIIWLFGLPFATYFFIFAKNIILIMAGTAFLPAAITLKILAALCLIVGLAYYMGYLVLYTQGREKIYTFATIVSAIFSVVVNIVMIPRYKQNGAAATQVAAELGAVLFMAFYIRKDLVKINFLNSDLLKVVLLSCFFFMLSYLYQIPQEFKFLQFSIITVIYFAVFYMALLLARERNIVEIVNRLKNVVKR